MFAMMKRVKLYQTLEDRGNPDYIESRGPFVCKRKDAWLGWGAYFWENDLPQATMWGAQYQDGFVICESEYDADNKNYLDLTTWEHYESMKKCQAMLEKKTNGNKVSLSQIIEFLKNANKFPYKAIRYVFRKVDTNPIIVSEWYQAVLLPPAESTQVCVVGDGFLLDDKYKIIYPPDYVL
jgi:hypothetical protein